jgi:hypothetical protein
MARTNAGVSVGASNAGVIASPYPTMVRFPDSLLEGQTATLEEYEGRRIGTHIEGISH